MDKIVKELYDRWPCMYETRHEDGTRSLKPLAAAFLNATSHTGASVATTK